MENHHAPAFTPGWNDPPSNVAPTVSGINKLQRHKRLVDPSITGYGGNPMTNNFSPYQQQQSPQFNQPQNPQFNQPQNPHLGQSLNSQFINQQSQQSFSAPAPQFGQQNPANLGQLSPGQTSNFSQQQQYQYNNVQPGMNQQTSQWPQQQQLGQPQSFQPYQQNPAATNFNTPMQHSQQM